MKAKMPGDSKPSLLLSREENDIVFRIIGQRCQSLATAVVQLFTTEGPAHNQWFKRDTGILCLIKDNVKRSYYFRIYCMQRKAMIWEHEVYTQIEYKSPRPFLHTFEAEDYMAAFNFANEDEAMILKNHLIEKIELRKQRREERRQKSMQQSTTSRASSVSSSRPASIVASNNVSAAQPHHHHHHHHGARNATPAPVTPVSPAPMTVQPPTHHHNGTSAREVPMPQKSLASTGYNMPRSANNKKNRSKKLTKADIGLPQDFKHVSHVGWDANRGFDIDNLPEKDMKDFFLRAGVSESQLSDKDTREFIYDFISSHGGVDAVKEALVEEDEVTPVPPRVVPKGGRAQMLPPVPARTPAALPTHAPPATAAVGPRLAPAPPAPPARALPPPPPPPQAQRNMPPVPAPPVSAIPPPPPPPPPAAMEPISAPSSAPSAVPASKPAQPDFRTALMESIRGGQNLKHVEVDRRSSNDDKRGDLLSEIRQGIELKSVSVNKNEEHRNSVTQGLAGALARALEERSKAIRSDSSGSDDDDTSDGEEWED